MFKYDKGGLPHPINNSFALNNERHNYNTRHNNDLQLNIMFILFRPSRTYYKYVNIL